MTKSYHLYILLSLFNMNKPIRANQIATIINGKRTGSTLYQALSLDLFPFFNIFPHLNRSDFESLIQMFKSKHLLDDKGNNYYVLTSEGSQVLDTFFSEYFYPIHMNNGKYGNGADVFFKRLVLAVQVVSEFIHHNKHYQPIIQHPQTHYFIKKWINYIGLNAEVAKDFSNELYNVLGLFDDEDALIIAENFSGNNYIGQTTYDIMEKRKLSKSNYHFYLKNTLHHLIQQLELQSDEFPLLYDLWKRTDYDTFHGLSKSAAETYYLLKRDYSFDEIARIKGVKKSTVLDQLIEIAIIIESFPINQFVSEKEKEIIIKYIKGNNDLRYKAFSDTFPDIAFYKYRLIQIEEIRVRK